MQASLMMNPLIMQAPVGYSEERDKEIKLRLQEVMNKYNIKQVEVAKETGINHSSLSLWLQGKIKGHMVKISETIENYLENFMSNKPRMNTMHISKLNLLKAPNNRIEDDSLDGAFNNGFGTLVPIKLDIEQDGKKLRENFLWDKNEPYLTLESFAKILIEEHNLTPLFEIEIVN
jgi:SWI/SNF-related matrix-associated actin-dependent regulator of chromatin subfamily B protein 1